MEKYRSHFDEVQRQTRIDSALKSLNLHYFDRSAPSRVISGVALSTRNRNSKGTAFHAAGMTSTLPCPILLEHDWNSPVGRILSLEVRGDEILFRGEVGNDMRRCDDIWMDIIIRSLTGVSVKAGNDVPSDATFMSWRLDELSLTRSGADEGAIITRCSERESVIYFDGRPSETVYWSTERYLHKPNETFYGSTP